MPMRTENDGINAGIPSDVLAHVTAIPVAGVTPGVSSGLPVAPADVSRTLQLYPWWLYKPSDAIDLLLDDQFTFGGAGTHTFGALSFQLPANSIGVIRSIDLYINATLTTTNVTWSLEVNGAAVPGYGQMTIFPRVAQSVSRGFDSLVFLPQGALITVTVTNVDGAAYQVGASYQGWHVSANVIQRNGLQSAS